MQIHTVPSCLWIRIKCHWHDKASASSYDCPQQDNCPWKQEQQKHQAIKSMTWIIGHDTNNHTSFIFRLTLAFTHQNICMSGSCILAKYPQQAFSYPFAYTKAEQDGFWFDSRPSEDLSVWSLHVLPVSAWVPFGCSGFSPTVQRHDS